MIGPQRYLRIRYEDLVLQPEQTLTGVCDFVGIGYSDQMLNYPQMVREKVPQDRRFLWPALSEPPKKSKTYRWKSQMAQKKRVVFEARAADLLDELGYDTYDHIPFGVSARLYDLWCYLGEGGRIDRLKRKLGLGGR